MSRTYRKRFVSYEFYWRNVTWYEQTKADKAKYYSDNLDRHWFRTSLPKWYRNRVNRDRRRFDKREIYKAINIENHEEQCSKWNCRDSDLWGYW